MQRHALPPRPDWPARVEALGFTYHSGDHPYWDESAYYRLTEAEVDRLEMATEELHALALEAVDYVVRGGWMERLGVPAAYADLVAASWQRRAPALYGRFDFSFDGGTPKLLEYNADTPTALLEAAVVQWHWLQDCFPLRDQFNSIHERLLARWQEIAATGRFGDAPLHFACLTDIEEDAVTTEYLRDLATQAGLQTVALGIDELGVVPSTGRFVDLEGREIQTLFKLYPWEWLLGEPAAPFLTPGAIGCVIEPAWKVLLSSKAILPVLWSLAPGHPNLLPAAYDAADLDGPLVRKPFFSREGEGVELLRGGEPVPARPHVYQRFHPLPAFSGRFPVIGSWVVGDHAAGIGIREGDGLVTTNSSRFVPHCF